MFKAIRDRLNNDDKGFTLIELMVVVLIIAILIAIAIPTFLGARSRAQDKQAQSNLRNALTAEKTFYTDSQIYTVTTTDLTPIVEKVASKHGDSRRRNATSGTCGIVGVRFATRAIRGCRATEGTNGWARRSRSRNPAIDTPPAAERASF